MTLGTAYSCIAYVNDAGKTEVMPNSDGDLITPCGVYFEDSRNVVVGQAAENTLPMSPERGVFLVKRRMRDKGARFEGLADAAPHGAAGICMRSQEARPRNPRPDVLGAAHHRCCHHLTCLLWLRGRGSDAPGWGDCEVSVGSVIPGRTAPTIACDMTEDSSGDETVLVYDRGGGTFGVTVIDSKGEISRSSAWMGTTI